jgi:hypothetical protein
MPEGLKKWYDSRIIRLCAGAILGAVADGMLNEWSWRQIVWVAVAAILVVLRADTTKGVTR